MFEKRCARHYKGKVYESFWIVEAYRVKGTSKHRYVVNVTDYTPAQRRKLLTLLNHPDSIVVQDLEDDFFEAGRAYGQIVFFLYQMKALGLTAVLQQHLSQKALALVIAVILTRIIHPASKLEAIGWVKDTAFPHFCHLRQRDYHANRVYEAMDEVYEKLEAIMEDFYQLSPTTPRCLLYDISSVYFEGRCVKTAKHGYSRDRRPDRPQVLLGLVLNEAGLPLHFEIFAGNVKDGTTVEGVVHKVKQRFDLDRAVMVGDRGMISADNLSAITGKGLGYIMALKHEAAKNLLREKQIQLELFDERLPVTILQEDGKKYVLCGSPYRKEHDTYVFDQMLAKGWEALDAVERMVASGRLKTYEKVVRRAQKKLTTSGAARYYDFSYDESQRTFTIIEKTEEIDNARSLCGYYILQTSETDLEDEHVEGTYQKLREGADVVRDLNNLLDIRPVSPWVDRQVRTHLFLCLLSQVVVSRVRRRLKEGGWWDRRKEHTLERFISLLGTIQVGEFRLGDETIVRVQRNNPLKQVLQTLFDLPRFDLKRDREICRV